jgi:predicted nucleic acid-binding protein
MNFVSIPPGDAVFLDANVLIYHFTNDAKYGAACTQLIKRVELQQLKGYTSAHILADVAHRLMTLEAMSRLGWLATGLAARLRRHRQEIPKLTIYQQAVVSIPHLRIHVIPLSQALVGAGVQLSQQHELLTDDALIVAMMQQFGLTSLASEDADFDGVPGIVRYSPL